MAASPPLLEIAASTQMDDDLSRRFKSFTLTNDEQGEILLSHDDVVESMAECHTSLLGKVISQKPPNLVGLKNTMEMVWGNPKNFRVLAVGDGVFQFIFPTELEASRVLRGKPWFFNNHFLNLERWQPSKAIRDYSFDVTPMWIQSWGLPLQFLSKDVGVKLGLRFGDVDEVVIPQSGSRDGRFLRIRTSLNVTQPLKRGCMVKFPGANPIWIEFRYEKLPSFCRYCGKVGHEFLACDKRFLDMEDEVFQSAEYGDWLRASPATQPGRRRNDSAPAGRYKAEDQNSASAESSAENQGRKSGDENHNSNSNRNENILVSNDKARVSSHEEMLMEAFLAERSVVSKPNQSPTLKGNQLMPFMEQVLQKFARPISTLTSHPVLAQPIPLSKPSPSPQSPNVPPIINHIIPLAQPSAPPTGPNLTHSIQLVSKTLTQTSGIISPFPANTQIPSQTPVSSPIIPTYIPPLSVPLNITTLSPDYPSLILVDIPISDGSLLSKSRKKRGSGVETPAPIRRRVLGEIQGNRQHNPTPPPIPKQKLNSNGKRNLENLENRVPNLAEVLAIPHGSGYDTRKKARGTIDGLALVAMDSSPAVAEETSPNWSPPNQ